jgi:heat shock protein HslJ
MKKVLLVLPIAIIMANCNTTHNTARSGNSGTTGSTASTTSTDMNNGTSGSGTVSSSGSGSATMGSTGSTSGTSGTESMGVSGSTATNSSGSTSMNTSSAGEMNVAGSATGSGNNNSSGMQTSGMTSNVYNGYDPHNYMQNPDKYKRPDELGKTGGWTYNTDWRRNTNYTADAAGQWQLVATPEVAANWMRDTSKPESYASYWTDEAMTARYNARMAAANAMRDSLAMANNYGNNGTKAKRGNRKNDGISGTGTTGAIGSGGSATMNNNGTTGAAIDDMSGTTNATGTTSATAIGTTNSTMDNTNTNGAIDNSSSAMSGNGSGNTNSYLTAVNGNTFMMPRLNLYLDNGTFTGYTGCNDIMGRVTVNGNQLHFEDATPSTNIQCMGGFDQSAFIDRLRRADSYDVVNNQIRIKQGDQVLMVLSKNSQ